MKPLETSIDPRNRTALITGATGGLGKAFAVECASRGWNLLLSDRNPRSLEILANGLSAGYAVRVLTFPADLTDPSSRAELFSSLHKCGIHPDILINVAGIDNEGLFVEQSARALTDIVRLNIEATLDVTRNCLPLRDPARRFTIINVASLAAFYPMPYKATYAASKRFLVDWSRALGEELRTENVSVTVLCPAGMPTHAECIRSIESQGFAGQITTVCPGRVADLTLNAALKGQKLVIPGRVNQVLRVLGALVPPVWVSAAIARRWRITRSRKDATNTPGSIMVTQQG